MNLSRCFFSLAAVAVLVSSGDAKATPAAYPNGNGIIAHSLDSFGVMFSNLCLDHAGDVSAQKAEMEQSAWDFQPMEDRKSRWHWRSIVFSVSQPEEPSHCGLTGMATGPEEIGAAVARFAEITGLGKAAIEQQTVGSEMLDLAFWTIGEKHQVRLVLSPQLTLHPDGSVNAGPAHITVVLSSQKKETK